MESGWQPWWDRPLLALGFGSNVASVMLVASGVPMCAYLFGRGVRDPLTFALAVLPLAGAAIAFSIVCLLVPSLVGERTTGFPLFLTLPAVYCGLVYVVCQVASAARPTLALIGEHPRADQLASRAELLAAGYAVLAVTLGLSAKLKSTVTPG